MEFIRHVYNLDTKARRVCQEFITTTVSSNCILSNVTEEMPIRTAGRVETSAQFRYSSQRVCRSSPPESTREPFTSDSYLT
jgi:hypothetical protein